MALNPQTPPTGQAYGEVFDRGYKTYDGPRHGRAGAVQSLISYSMKRALGFRQNWKAKIGPIFLYAAIFIPVIVMVAVMKVMQSFGIDGAQEMQNNLVTYPDFYDIIVVLVGLFIAIAAPEVICVDRRERTLPLYFSRAIKRSDYVFAKFVAVCVLGLTMTAIPGAILWLGWQMIAPESLLDAMAANAGDLGRVLLISLIISVTFSAIGLMISSFTNRKGVAQTLIVLGFLVFTGATAGVWSMLQDRDWAKYVLLLNPQAVFTAIDQKLFDQAPRNEMQMAIDFSAVQLTAYLAALSLICLLIFRWRYAARDDA